MKVTYSDKQGRFSKKEITEILSEKNRRECREKLKRAPSTDDLIYHYLERKDVEVMVCGC